jgi:hypothetical protein
MSEGLSSEKAVGNVKNQGADLVEEVLGCLSKLPLLFKILPI